MLSPNVVHAIDAKVSRPVKINPVMMADYRGRVYYRSKTHKRIFMAWCYGATTKRLARKYGLRRVNEVKRAVLAK